MVDSYIDKILPQLQFQIVNKKKFMSLLATVLVGSVLWSSFPL